MHVHHRRGYDAALANEHDALRVLVCAGELEHGSIQVGKRRGEQSRRLRATDLGASACKAE